MSEHLPLVGEVIHYFPKVGAAVVKFKEAIKIGVKVKIVGERGEKREPYEFDQIVGSLQKDRSPVEGAKTGDELGMKVDKEVQEGDSVFLTE